MRPLQVILFIILPLELFASKLNIDLALRKYINDFNVKSPSTIKNDRPLLYQFGKKLFQDNSLSLSKNITCMSCHHPKLGSSDRLPLSIGTGGRGHGIGRFQNGAAITSRSAPHLYNKGHPSLTTMFWDGRVSYDRKNHIFYTPEEKLNGHKPTYHFITSKLENVMAMQALFPIASTAEMRGEKFKHLTNLEVWRLVTNNILKNSNYKEELKHYKLKTFNIADIANALAYFQKIEFQVNNTPFDNYLKGNNQALSIKEKEGAIIFFQKARCARCHSGQLLSNQKFQNIASPQIGQGVNNPINDKGRYLITQQRIHQYAFFTQPLRNIALTAPYFHNGAYKTIKEVIEHYNSPHLSLLYYDITNINHRYRYNYDTPLYLNQDTQNNKEKLNFLDPILKKPLELSQNEIKSLTCFLKKSLTQKKLHNQISFNECNNQE
ncbi:MAG: hypothetical protein N4A33_03020 [Bacteriovoracaceae bacterium]|jgi:cytochrome c peroxidase|nr:hypothetical protein [Bacteriovoracaceae bacterium]